MRTLAPKLSVEVSRRITRPGYLIQIDWPLGTAYYSSRGTRTFNGQIWQEFGLTYSQASRSGEGVFTANVSLRNTDRQVGIRALNEDIREARIQVWQVNGQAAMVTAADVFYEFDGRITGYNLAVEDLRLNCTTAFLSNSFTPRRSVARWNGYNYLTPPNKVLTWGNRVFRATRAD